MRRLTRIRGAQSHTMHGMSKDVNKRKGSSSLDLLGTENALPVPLG